jgi:hypothetical protein
MCQAKIIYLAPFYSCNTITTPFLQKRRLPLGEIRKFAQSHCTLDLFTGVLMCTHLPTHTHIHMCVHSMVSSFFMGILGRAGKNEF